MQYLTQRVLQAGILLLAMSLVVFVGLYNIGDPLELYVTPEADDAERARVAVALGLDQPLWRQYLRFLGNLLQGDLGTSFVYNQPAVELIFSRFSATFELAIFAVGLAVVLGIPLGLIAGVYEDHWVSKLITGMSVLAFSIPAFWVGITLIMLFAVQLGVLPSSGRGETVRFLGADWSFLTANGLKHLLLPGLSLGLYKLALVIRLTRSGVQDAAGMEFVKFARAKGLSERRIVFVHILKFVIIPILTVTAMEFGSTIAFAVVTESIFSWPGMGKLIIDSINNLDRPVVVAYLMIISLLFVTINLSVDLLYLLLDPRTRKAGGRAA